jgi:hypothetical protein
LYSSGLSSHKLDYLADVHDVRKANTMKFPKRAAVGGEKQLFTNCILFQKGNIKLDRYEGDWFKYTIFIDGLVAEERYNSWAPKPG